MISDIEQVKLPKRPKPSYNCLKECLRCANAEAKGYLDQVSALRDENRELTHDLKTWREAACVQRRVIDALLDLVEAKRGTKS